jgi:hypothetical protein
MAAQVDMFHVEPVEVGEPAPLRRVERRTDYETDRPPFAASEGWDRMVHITRARDRLRRMGATDGEVVPGPHPVFRSKSRPEIETPL